MNNISEVQVLAAEERLRAAMLEADIAALDELLAAGLLFTDHCGQLHSKQDEIAAYLSGALKVEKLVPSELRISLSGDTAVVSVRVQVAGRYAGLLDQADLRFTRLWQRSSAGAWQVVAAHSSRVR